jgi:hypothetical protein
MRLLLRTIERGAGRAEIVDAGPRSDVWAEDNPQPRDRHTGANVLSNFCRTKYQDSRGDREVTSPARRGATAGLSPSGYQFCQWGRLTKSFI